MQKIGELENDAGFLKHIYSHAAKLQLLFISLDYSGYSFLGCTSMVSLSGC